MTEKETICSVMKEKLPHVRADALKMQSQMEAGPRNKMGIERGSVICYDDAKKELWPERAKGGRKPDRLKFFADKYCGGKSVIGFVHGHPPVYLGKKDGKVVEVGGGDDLSSADLGNLTFLNFICSVARKNSDIVLSCAENSPRTGNSIEQCSTTLAKNAPLKGWLRKL